jgi:hypothetical protein
MAAGFAMGSVPAALVSGNGISMAAFYAREQGFARFWQIQSLRPPFRNDGKVLGMAKRQG